MERGILIRGLTGGNLLRCHRFEAILVIGLALAPAVSSASERFAIVLGNNEGAPGRAKLWFAEQDADHFAKTLIELGELPKEHATLLKNARLAQVRDAFHHTEREVQATRAAGKRAVLVVYFSGHADTVGLELGPEQLPYDELRQLVTLSTADVRVAIVDACDAGTLTQVKGASAAPTVSFPLPGEESVEGVAFVASTAAGEAAQESSSLGGSFFTHHLEVAMRGAGDFDGDGMVTLAEAFRYASGRTVSGTFGTQAGPQHPTYSLRMSGRGDVVLSDLRRAESRLSLPADAKAQYIFHGPDGLVAEVDGTPTPFTLALPAGDYSVERRAGGKRQIAQMTLVKGVTEELPALGPVEYELASRKGGPRLFEAFIGPTLAGPAIGGPSLPSDIARFGWAPGVRAGAGYRFGKWTVRLRAQYVQSFVDLGPQHLGFRSVTLAPAALFSIVQTPVQVELGPEVGYTRCFGTFGTDHCYKPSDTSAGVAAAVSVPLGPIRARLEVDVPILHLNPVSAFPVVEAAVTMSYSF